MHCNILCSVRVKCTDNSVIIIVLCMTSIVSEFPWTFTIATKCNLCKLVSVIQLHNDIKYVTVIGQIAAHHPRVRIIALQVWHKLRRTINVRDQITHQSWNIPTEGLPHFMLREASYQCCAALRIKTVLQRKNRRIWRTVEMLHRQPTCKRLSYQWTTH